MAHGDNKFKGWNRRNLEHAGGRLGRRGGKSRPQQRKRIVEIGIERMLHAGIPAEEFDLWTGMISGLVWQQIANEPGGDRWTKHVDDLVDMFLDHVNKTKNKRGRRK